MLVVLCVCFPGADGTPLQSLMVTSPRVTWCHWATFCVWGCWGQKPVDLSVLTSLDGDQGDTKLLAGTTVHRRGCPPGLGPGWEVVGLGLAPALQVDRTACWLWKEREMGFSCLVLQPGTQGWLIFLCLSVVVLHCGSLQNPAWSIWDIRQPSKLTTSCSSSLKIHSQSSSCQLSKSAYHCLLNNFQGI